MTTPKAERDLGAMLSTMCLGGAATPEPIEAESPVFITTDDLTDLFDGNARLRRAAAKKPPSKPAA